MISHRLDYFKSFTNFIEIGAYLFAMLLIIDVSDLGRNTGVREVSPMFGLIFQDEIK